MTIEEIYNKLELKPPVDYALEQFNKHAQQSKLQFDQYDRLSLQFVGRQCGMTTLSVVTAISEALKGNDVAYVGQTSGTVNYARKQAQKYLHQLGKFDYIGLIKFFNQDDPEMPNKMRGYQIYKTIVDSSVH